MEQFTNWLIASGISKELLILLVSIPVTATLTNIARYIIGFKTLGIYSTIILALAYYLSGARYGIIITIVVVIATIITYSLLKKVRMHYLSRVAINYFVIAIIITMFFLLINLVPQIQMDMDFKNINPLSIILIASLSDFIMKMSIKKDVFTIVRSTGETIIIALLGWGIIRFPTVSDTLINNLWIILVLVILNFLIGKSTDLRLLEHLRFKQILSSPANSPKSDKSDTK